MVLPARAENILYIYQGIYYYIYWRPAFFERVKESLGLKLYVYGDHDRPENQAGIPLCLHTILDSDYC